jgi:hypothetical protein
VSGRSDAPSPSARNALGGRGGKPAEYIRTPDDKFGGAVQSESPKEDRREARMRKVIVDEWMALDRVV